MLQTAAKKHHTDGNAARYKMYAITAPMAINIPIYFMRGIDETKNGMIVTIP